jgi:hypothetical protein
MSCGLCNSLFFGSYYQFENTCNHSICIDCHEISINHTNCNHFMCPICLVPELFNEILSNPNRIIEALENGTSLFTYPTVLLSLPLGIEEKYLIYKAPILKNYFTIQIDTSDEPIKLDLTYVFINKADRFSGQILIGKIDKKITFRQYDLFNTMMIDRITGQINRYFSNPTLLKRIDLHDMNQYHIYKCVDKE